MGTLETRNLLSQKYSLFCQFWGLTSVCQIRKLTVLDKTNDVRHI